MPWEIIPAFDVCAFCYARHSTTTLQFIDDEIYFENNPHRLADLCGRGAQRGGAI
jgi:hypothetical protein